MLPNFKKGISLMSDTVDHFPWDDRYAYGLYLSQTYYYVIHSTRLLALASGLMKVQDTPFHLRFLQHANEEKGHDLMAVNDLNALGFDIKDFPELPQTRMFWETQYYKVQHNDPLSLMGYIVALETIACEQCPPMKKRLEKVHPEGSTTFVRVHAEDDPGHVEMAWKLILSLPEDRRKWIEENYDQTVIGYKCMVDGMLTMIEEKRSLMKVA